MPTIQNRRATAAQWTAANPVLAAGEFGFELDTNKVKVGDGLKAWDTLSYFIDEDGILEVGASQFTVKKDVLRAGTWAEIGDSLTARNRVLTWGTSIVSYLETGWGTHLRPALGQRGRMVGMFAVSGKRADEVLAEQVPQVLALDPPPAFCHVLCGTNDIAALATVEQITSRLGSIYDALQSSGIHVVAGLIPPRGLVGGNSTPEKKLTTWEVNTWIRDQSKIRSGFDAIDYFTALSDTEGDFATELTADGLHQSSAGAASMARAAMPVFSRLLPMDQPFPLPGDLTNIAPNPFSLGVAGTKDTGATGDVATSCYLAPLSPGTVIASKEPRVDIPGEWQVLDITSGDWRLTRTIPLDSLEIGASYIGRAEVEVEGSRPSKLIAQFTALGPNSITADSCYHEIGNPVGPIYVPPKSLLETPPAVIPATVTQGQLQVRIVGGSGGKFRIGRVQVVKVSN